MTSALTAAKAYSQVQAQFARSMSEAGGPSAPASGPAGVDFGQLLTGAMNDITQTGKMAEKQMLAHANGRAELVDVVTAVASAQTSLETAMAVRDQVIAAYQEIMRMPI